MELKTINLMGVTIHNAYDGKSYEPHGPPPTVKRFEASPGFWHTYIPPDEMPAKNPLHTLIVPASVRAAYPKRNDLISPGEILSATKDSLTCYGFEVSAYW